MADDFDLVDVEHDPFNHADEMRQQLGDHSSKMERAFVLLAEHVKMLTQELAMVSAKQQELMKAVGAPKKIVRDENGWPSGIVVDNEPLSQGSDSGNNTTIQ